MELDTAKALERAREEEERQKIRDERKLIDEIYKDYLLDRHPHYPVAKKKIAVEEQKTQFDDYYKPTSKLQQKI